MTLIYSVCIDWDGDGSFVTAGDDVTAYFESMSITTGIGDPDSLLAYVGELEITFNNEDRLFSPAYTAGPYYGKLVPNKPVRVQVSDGTTTWTLFRGVTRKFPPTSGQYGPRECVVRCVNVMAQIQDEMISIPLQSSVTADTLVKHIVNAVLKAPVATATLTYSAKPSNNDTVTANGTAYTYKTALTPTAGEVLIGTDTVAAIQDLTDAINNDDGAGTGYASNTTRAASVTAAASAGTGYDASNYDSDVSLRMSGAGGTTTITSTGSGFSVGFNGADIWVAQSFQVTAGKLSQFTVTWGASTGVPTGGVTWEIRPDAGGTSGPASTVLATGTFTPTASGTNTISGLTSPILAGSTKYWLMIRTTNVQPAATYYLWQTQGSSTYANGNISFSSNSGASWTDFPADDAQCSFTTTALSSKDRIAQRFQVATRFATASIQLYLKKVGAATGTLTLRIETDSTTGPSGTLVDSNATTTVAESTLLATGYSLITFTLPASVTLETNRVYWLVLSTDRVSAATAGVFWGGDGSAPSYAYGGVGNGMWNYNGATWAAETKDAVFVLGMLTLTLTANLRGAIGNSYTLAKSSSAITLSGATLSGGSDYPTSPASSLQTGVRTFDIAADKWSAENETNGMTALQEVVDSEQGLLWVARDGTITFKNLNYALTRVTGTAAVLTLSSEHNGLEGGLDHGQVYNRIEVTYTPRSLLSSGVVAKATGIIEVPGFSGYTRPNPTTFVVNNANLTKLPFKDPATGASMGAQSIVTPLVPGPSNDYTVFEDPAGVWGDYTFLTAPDGKGWVRFSLAINGNNVEISIANLASGKLYIHRLQVRGVGIVDYNPSQEIREDSTSQNAYGKRMKSVELPLPSGQLFAQSLANYLLSRFKDPTHRVDSISFSGATTVGTVNLFSIEIGDMIVVTDYQTGISAQYYLVTGVRYEGLMPQDPGTITFNVRRLDDTLYGVWDDATYGKWDTAKWSL